MLHFQSLFTVACDRYNNDRLWALIIWYASSSSGRRPRPRRSC